MAPVVNQIILRPVKDFVNSSLEQQYDQIELKLRLTLYGTLHGVFRTFLMDWKTNMLVKM